MTTNKQIRLVSRPEGVPEKGNFEIVESPVPEPADGEVLVRSAYLSVDPYMRGRLRDRKSYADPVAIGDVMVGESVGYVEKSRADGFSKGDAVAADFGWQQFGVLNATKVRKLKSGLPISTALHVIGMPGLTAYFGLLHVCEPKSGETVVVSGAAGAVGTIVGQIAKLHGCRVVGVCGSEEKIDFITKELGFDEGINYKTSESIYKDLKKACPEGIDVYFDNVGGTTTDAVFSQLNVHARMAICGQISQYNLAEAELGPRVLWNLIVKRAKVQGLLVTDFAPHYASAIRELFNWVSAGKIKYRETVAEGIENAPHAFISMLAGANIGKQLVRISSGESHDSA